MKRQNHRRKGGSLVFPVLLILLGVLLMLDNIGLMGGIDWSTVWKLWPIILIAMGLEVLLGRRVSFGGALLVVLIIVVAAAGVWWSALGGKETESKHYAWPIEGIERAKLELDVGAGELRLTGQSDMADLMTADLEVFSRSGVSANKRVSGGVARVRIQYREGFLFVPGFLGGDHEEWDLKLNSRLRWEELNIDAGAGDVRLDLSELKVSHLDLHSGIGSIRVTLPERGSLEGRIDGGIGDIRITVPEGVQARFRVERGLGDVTIGSRFNRRGDYYETEGFGRAESYIELDVDIGIGSITIH